MYACVRACLRGTPKHKEYKKTIIIIIIIKTCKRQLTECYLLCNVIYMQNAIFSFLLI